MAKDTYLNLTPDKREITLYGLPADGKYRVEIEAFRAVDQDIDADGVIESSVVVAPASPYQPSPKVLIDKNVEIGGVPANQLVDAIKDVDGVVRPTREQIAATKAIIDAAIAKTDAEVTKVRVDLVPTIANAKQAGEDARAAATQISVDLSAEVQRAQAAEGTLRTRIESAQGGADGALSLIATETTQRKDADSALTQRVETIISTANTDRTNSNTAITNEITARANAIDSVGRRIDTIVTDYQGSNGATNTRIQTEELARASGDDALGRRTTTLESRSGGAGNLLSNTDLSNLTGWTQTYGSAGLYLNAAGSTWQLGNIENNISFHDVNPSTSVYSQVTSDAFAVEGGSFIQFYALASAHRSRAWITLFFYDKTGALTDYAGENFGVREGAAGAEINQQDQIGLKSFRIPNTAVAARMALRIYPNMPANDPYAWFARPYAGIAREGQNEWNFYSPGSAKVVLSATNAAIRDEQDTRASQTLALAIRSNTLEAQFRGEQASYINTRIANEEIARSTAVESIAVRSNTLESMFRGETESSLLARIRTEETTRSNADAAIANRATSLEARSTGGGNLITNTDFVTTTGWTPSTNLTGIAHQINAAGDYYHPFNENVLSITQGPYNGLGSGGYADWFSSRFAVSGNSFLQVYAYLNCHRCNVEFYIAWVNFEGAIFAYSQKSVVGPINNLGVDINSYNKFGWPSIQVPSSAVAAAVCFRKYDTFYGGDPNSYAWCLRPYAGAAREGQTEWNSYSPGSGKAALVEATARITSEEIARSSADGALSSRIDTVSADYKSGDAANRAETARVNQEVINTNAQVSSVNQASADRDGALGVRIDSVAARAGNLESSASTTSAAIANLNGRTAAYVQTTAVAGNNRAQITVRADANGGAGVDIVGDVNFAGNLKVQRTTGGKSISIDSDTGITFNNGTVMKVSGVGFGSSNQFIEWIGPSQSSLAGCTEANAIQYIKTNGSAYFGGTLSAGILKNAVQTTRTDANAEVTTGVFGSNGGTRNVVVSYQFNAHITSTNKCPANPVQPSVTVELFRGTSASGPVIGTRTLTGSYSCENGSPNEPAPSDESIGGSFTFTDNAGGSSASYYVRITNRSINISSGQQSLGIVSSEG